MSGDDHFIQPDNDDQPKYKLSKRLRGCVERRELPTWGEIEAAADELDRLGEELRRLEQQDEFMRELKESERTDRS